MSSRNSKSTQPGPPLDFSSRVPRLRCWTSLPVIASNGSPNDDPYSEPLGDSEEEDPFHFAPSLVSLIQHTPHQEIATHTYSHYYTEATWADASTLRADFEAARAIAQASGVTLHSIVFPRNQVGRIATEACRNAGWAAYRGKPTHWEWSSKSNRSASPVMRLADAYVPLRIPQSVNRTPSSAVSSRVPDPPSAPSVSRSATSSLSERPFPALG